MKHENINALEDSELIERYKSHQDKNCIGVLYKRYAVLVYGLCYKYLQDEESSEDAVVDIFEILMEKLAIAEINYFKSWLFIVSKNHLLAVLRKRKNNPTYSFDELEENNSKIFVEKGEEITLNEDTEIIEKNEAWVQEGIKTLKPPQQVCLDLFYIQQMSYQQIAALTGYEIKHVKSHIQNGKRNLRIFLESKGYSNG